MAQGLRLRASNTEGENSVPGQRTVIPVAAKKYKNKKTKFKKNKKKRQSAKKNPPAKEIRVEVTDLAPLCLMITIAISLIPFAFLQ